MKYRKQKQTGSCEDGQETTLELDVMGTNCNLLRCLQVSNFKHGVVNRTGHHSLSSNTYPGQELENL